MMGKRERERERENGTVTRFDEISPGWQKFKCNWPFLEDLLSIWPTFESTFASFFVAIEQISNVGNGQILNN